MYAAVTPPAGPSLRSTLSTRLALSDLHLPVSAMCSHEGIVQSALMLVLGHAGMLGCGCMSDGTCSHGAPRCPASP